MNRQILLVILSFITLLQVCAQRSMENLDRGLVAVKVSKGVYLSWRLLGQEWYDVNYNVYRDGTLLNSEPLTTSNYLDDAGTASSTYTVRAVVRGIEQEAGKAVTPWRAQYMDIPMQPVMNNGVDVSAQYTLNDVNAADLDGDGEYELIVKRQNSDFTKANTIYTLFQAYKLDGTLLWTLNVGPNLINAGHVETDCMAFDFNQDGKAEAVVRLTDGSILPDGTVVGNASVNYRPVSYSDGNSVYQTQGDEWLYVLEGATGKVIDNVIFDTDVTNGNNLARRSPAFWWGGNSKAYGHRANKFHFGAPYLDGRTPSIYVGRGCYTNIHMATYDLVNNKLKRRWAYTCDDAGSKFYGQGFHNFSIVDVDEDGRDEICHGNMVIDEYGKELSSTGLGHGDAQHYGDLDPYRKGVEGFRCLEDNPGAVLVDAATNEILFRWVRGRDNGRCLAGNFTDNWKGAELWTTDGHLWSATTSRAADEIVANSAPGVTMNFRIYWDGDILDESFDYASGANTDGAVYKYGNTSPIFTTSGCATNNGTKGTPCLQADLFGDWREEIVMRTTDEMKLRIYTTTIPTAHRNYTLMHDKQYRQAIYWQMCGYNQPPHVSYFLGEAEGITVPPPPVMNNGRTEITSSITAAENDKHLLLAGTTGGTVSVASGAAPYIVTVNSPEDYTLTGAPFTGNMRLIKQGPGTLTFSGDQTYTGATELWGGVVNFEGTMLSPVWMNRFAELNTAATYNAGIVMEYGSILRVGGANAKGEVSASSLVLNEGAIVEADIYSADLSADKLTVSGTLNLSEGCVFRFIQHNNAGESAPAAGEYLLASVGTVTGDLSKVTVEGLLGVSCDLKEESGKIYLVVNATRAAAAVLWSGSEEGSVWDLNNAKNFVLNGEAVEFITGDNVSMDETAVSKTVTISGSVVPSTVTVSGAERYTIKGDGCISGDASLVKEGTGILGISNINDYSGKTVLSGGSTSVAALATSQGAGALGKLSTDAANFIMENGAILSTSSELTQESAMTLGEGGGTLYVGNKLHLKGTLAGGTLTKQGNGTLCVYAANTHKKTILDAGTIQVMEEPGSINGYFGDTLVLNGGTIQCLDNSYSYSSAGWNIVVPEGKSATINLDGRCNYTGSLTGAGTLTLNMTYVRTYMEGNWSKFAGTINVNYNSSNFTFRNGYGMPLATLNVGNGTTVTNEVNGNIRIGGATGSGTLGGSNTWEIGRDGKDCTFAGTIASALTKVGSNTQTLSGINTFSGATAVKEGTLCVSSTTATKSNTGAGTLTVYDGAVLTGWGYIGNSRVNIENGGTLKPGLYNTGKMAMATILDVREGGVVEMYLSGNGRVVTLTDMKNLLFKGTLRITMRSSYVPSLGDSFTLWESKSFNSNYIPTLELPELPEGLSWDTSALFAPTGILTVTDATGLRLTSWNEPVHATIVTLNGVTVDNFDCNYDEVEAALNATSLPSGLYIVRMKSANGIGSVKMIKR